MLSEKEQISFKQSQMKIVDIYAWLQGGILQYKIKIQRNSAWKDEDRQELIDTIVNGYPIPSIFISSGMLDVEKKQSIYHVLDGRQRLETIQKFIDGEFEYNNQLYEKLSTNQRIKILNYFIPIITIDDSNISQLKEIFRRLNKLAIKLNKIEITSSQYFEFSFMIFAKLAVTTIDYEKEIEEYIKETSLLYQNSDEETDEGTDEEIDETSENSLNVEKLKKELTGYEDILKENQDVFNLFTNKKIFSEYEINRQVNLQHFLNIFVTIIEGEKAISRSVDASKKKWQKKIEEFSISETIKAGIIEKYKTFKKVCSKVNEIFEKLNKNSIFCNKSTLYTLTILFYYNLNLLDEDMATLIGKLEAYNDKEDKYKGLTQERVNDLKFRLKRYEVLEKLFFPGKNN